MNMKRKGKLLNSLRIAALSSAVIGLAACGSDSTQSENSELNANSLSLEQIETNAKEEGEVNSVGMPDTWANWGETWTELSDTYSLQHTDTDMSSAEEIAKFEAEKKNATADIGDVGISFGPIAEEKNLTIAYKTSYWDEIPEWAKDDDGDWIVGYQGTIAVITNKELVKEAPKSWEDLLNGDYKVALGDVQRATQAQMSVLAAAIAHGGDESNLQPGIEFFSKIAEQGRLSLTDPSLAMLESGEVEVALMWDFNALGYADELERERFEVSILEEGSVVSGYATILNKYGQHPHAAMLTREFILSDEGQINLAKGYARPIRDNVELPAEVAEKMIPKEQYENAKPVGDYKVWEETAKQLPTLWQEEVLVHVK